MDLLYFNSILNLRNYSEITTTEYNEILFTGGASKQTPDRNLQHNEWSNFFTATEHSTVLEFVQKNQRVNTG